MVSRIAAVLRHLHDPVSKESRFLHRASGVIHVGANTGQERFLYRMLGLRVIWIEPIPEVYDTLVKKIGRFRKQRALQYLVTDEDGREYEFNVATNNGASSSILDLGMHRDIWPDVGYERKIKLRSTTLPTVVEDAQIDLHDFDALIMDVQGAELLVLQGAAPILDHFTYVKTEVPDFEAYEGCCQLSDIAAFLTSRGYTEHARREFARRDAGGSYYDVVYKRDRAAF
jgi:FkbM family methyltransferase